MAAAEQGRRAVALAVGGVVPAGMGVGRGRAARGGSVGLRWSGDDTGAVALGGGGGTGRGAVGGAAGKGAGQAGRRSRRKSALCGGAVCRARAGWTGAPW